MEEHVTFYGKFRNLSEQEIVIRDSDVERDSEM